MQRIHENQPTKEERRAKQEESKMLIKLESKDDEKVETNDEKQIEEKSKDEDFVIVDDAYLDGVA